MGMAIIKKKMIYRREDGIAEKHEKMINLITVTIRKLIHNYIIKNVKV